MSVKIVNMSDFGAKLVMGVVWPCPPYFDLEIDNPNTGQPVKHHCELIWQRGHEIGLRFIIKNAK